MRSSSFGSAQQRQRLAAVVFADGDFRFRWVRELCLIAPPAAPPASQHAAQVAFGGVFFHAQLFRGLLDEGRALARGIEIERVHVEAVAVGSQQIHLQQLVAEVLGEAADAVAAVVVLDGDFVAFDSGVLVCDWLRGRLLAASRCG